MTDEIAVPEFVEYCQVQAGLLSGHVEEMSDEIDDLLDDLDAELAEIRGQLGEEGTASPQSTTGDQVDIERLEGLEGEIEQKQTLVEAKQARMTAFQELAVAYTELAADLAGTTDGQAALERVVEFEIEHDAPAYFPDRQTVAEAAAESSDA